MRFILFCLILIVLTSLCQSNDGNDDHIHFHLSPVSQEQGKDRTNESTGEFPSSNGRARKELEPDVVRPEIPGLSGPWRRWPAGPDRKSGRFLIYKHASF